MVVSDVLREVDVFGSTMFDDNEAGLIFIRKLQNGGYHVVIGENTKNICELSKAGLIRFLHSIKVK